LFGFCDIGVVILLGISFKDSLVIAVQLPPVVAIGPSIVYAGWVARSVTALLPHRLLTARASVFGFVARENPSPLFR